LISRDYIDLYCRHQRDEGLNRRENRSWIVRAARVSRSVAACLLVGLLATACESPPAPVQPECRTRRDCADGFTCVAGDCVMVSSTVGDPCDREADCGPGQTCATTGFDGDGDGEPDTLSPTCQPSAELIPAGAACASNDECASSACSFGRCIELCMQDDDCRRGGAACVEVPYMFSPRAIDEYKGCMPAAGVLAVDLPTDDDGLVHVPVPGNALSLTLVTDIGDPNMMVGMTRLVSPSGTLLWNKPGATDPIGIEQPVRYAPGTETSSFMLPSSSEAQLEPGVYRVNVAAWQRNQLLARLQPRVRAIYRLGVEGKTLDINFHFMNLVDHACVGSKPLDATRAAEKTSQWQTEVLPSWRTAFSQAGLALGTISYVDEKGRPDLDAVRPDELGALFELGDRNRPGLDVYVVRSLYPLGVLAASGGAPGPLEKGTAHSGIVVSADALCVLGHDDFGRLIAHAAARYLGLFETVDVNGRHDPLTSTSDSANNLVYFRLGASSQLTDEQADILRKSPVLR